jgi:hypothetical protein
MLEEGSGKRATAWGRAPLIPIPLAATAMQRFIISEPEYMSAMKLNTGLTPVVAATPPFALGFVFSG